MSQANLFHYRKPRSFLEPGCSSDFYAIRYTCYTLLKLPDNWHADIERMRGVDHEHPVLLRAAGGDRIAAVSVPPSSRSDTASVNPCCIWKETKRDGYMHLRFVKLDFNYGEILWDEIMSKL